MRNRGQSFCKQKISPGDLKHRYDEFSQNFDWEIMAIISLKLRNPGFEIFEFVFQESNHCIAKDDHAAFQQIA